LVEEAEKAAQADQNLSDIEKVVARKAPALGKLTVGISMLKTDDQVRATVSKILAAADEVFVEIDEVECPHCGGRGMTGVIQNLCAFCHGSCVVTQAEYDDYDRNAIDEVECPHCGGRGITGLNGVLCAYCKGSCVVTHDSHDAYDPKTIDEVDCPHCGGRGLTGLNSEILRVL